MQGILSMKKSATPTKKQTALERYEQSWQAANTVYDGMEQMVDRLSNDIIKALQKPKKRR